MAPRAGSTATKGTAVRAAANFKVDYVGKILDSARRKTRSVHRSSEPLAIRSCDQVFSRMNPAQNQ